MYIVVACLVDPGLLMILKHLSMPRYKTVDDRQHNINPHPKLAIALSVVDSI